jgi:hypothetical protein
LGSANSLRGRTSPHRACCRECQSGVDVVVVVGLVALLAAAVTGRTCLVVGSPESVHLKCFASQHSSGHSCVPPQSCRILHLGLDDRNLVAKDQLRSKKLRSSAERDSSAVYEAGLPTSEPRETEVQTVKFAHKTREYAWSFRGSAHHFES